MSAYFESVGDIWIIWAIALTLIAYCIRRAVIHYRKTGLRKFEACESGASYALPYILTFPIFIFLMAVFLQSSLILMAKIGTVYSAHAAARSYIVWNSAAQDISVRGFEVDYAKFSAKRAASQAMVPFSSSNPKHLEDIIPGTIVGTITGDGDSPLPTLAATALAFVDRELYIRMYQRILADANENDSADTHAIINDPSKGANDKYIKNKYLYAVAATRVYTPDELVPWNEDVEVRISYKMAFQIPGTARVLGGRRLFAFSFFDGIGETFFRDIETTVKLPSEAAKTDDGKIGIPYQPSLLLEAIN